MCKYKISEKLHDDLMRPMNFDQTAESLWNDKCDYIDIDPDKCDNLNPNNMSLIVLQLNIHSIIPHQTELVKLLTALEVHRS